jgi:hypothetical protein
VDVGVREIVSLCGVTQRLVNAVASTECELVRGLRVSLKRVTGTTECELVRGLRVSLKRVTGTTGRKLVGGHIMSPLGCELV